MGHKPIAKMTIENRAKQFMPFAALRGLNQALAAKEKIIVDKKELSEEMKQELDLLIHEITKGSMVSVVYYEDGEYIKKNGIVAKINADTRTIQVVDVRIDFDNIYSIEIP